MYLFCLLGRLLTIFLQLYVASHIGYLSVVICVNVCA